MSAQDGVTWICSNQGLVSEILSYAWAWMPIASVVAWVTAKYKAIPPWAQAILQTVAGNFAHAAESVSTGEAK